MNIDNPIFHNESKARAYLEAKHWPDGPVCPHCQTRNNATPLKGAAHREGVYQCNAPACRLQFSVTVNTVMERSKVPLHKWLLAIHIMSASKTGVSAHQIGRMLGLSYKTAWFLCHRIREAMSDTNSGPLGNTGGPVQVDETYQGNTSKRSIGHQKGMRHKQQVVALVEPASGRVKAFHVKNANSDKLRDILFQNINRKAILVTDESKLYRYTAKAFGGHQTVKHAAGNYVNKKGFHTNNVENFFGVFKRGLKAHIVVSEQHLKRYVAECAFRYSNRDIDDTARAAKAIEGAYGKRLMYQRPL